eukprot:TRINITY_DN108819_c0_g1_i1.p1 TRINITY_DN108819_c0_g1~~TRINITY_DN108819_c0_g1_i1.p1  ORF type:complete len:270 (+),score=66.74 TRINITY_DN108819_c0_g1_i1:41-850(+)
MPTRDRPERPLQSDGSYTAPGSAGSASSSAGRWSLKGRKTSLLGGTSGGSFLGRTGAAVLGSEERGSSRQSAFSASLPAGLLRHKGSAFTPSKEQTPPTSVPASATSSVASGESSARGMPARCARQGSGSSPLLGRQAKEEAAAEDLVQRHPRLTKRRYSALSKGALSQLAGVEAQVLAVEARVRELQELALEEAQRSQVQVELAQLEAQANKLECEGVDNVYTGELESGKAEAKDFKKSLLGRLEQIFALIEETFKQLKEAESKSLSA